MGTQRRRWCRRSRTSSFPFPPCVRSSFFISRYSKSKLALAPNNPSAWNYLRGSVPRLLSPHVANPPHRILTHTTTPLSLLIPFVSPLAILSSAPSAAADDPPISDKAQLPAPLAIEFLADAMAQEGREKGAQAAEVRFLVLFAPVLEKLRS